MQTVFKRYEKKYLLTPAQRARLLEEAGARLAPDGYGRHGVMSLYYDTPDCRLIRASLEKPVYKEKLRLRAYGVPGPEDTAYVEIKKKFKGVVYKRREAMSYRDAAAWLRGEGRPPKETQITREIDYFLSFYQPGPRALIAYRRESFLGRDDPELRVTFDDALRFRETALSLSLGAWGEPLLPPGTVLMEIKIPGATPLWLSRALSDIGIFPQSFSKYGTAYRTYIQQRTGGVLSA